MRISRLVEELKTSQQDLEGYDDIAVAHDRLGKSDEAIEWMAKKEAVLRHLDQFSSSPLFDDPGEI